MAKSPVYGVTRGPTARRRTFHAAAGSVNLKGRRTRRMSCGCCTCLDLRGRVIDRQHAREMRDLE
ncbi:hypothetical protein LAZ40_11160 [Cereibacter sphaeroides]|uniref:hypothetical protein n=1 Tax=Cereibacter sphaeroides TaxID=1063 RepID=UPI001F442813|nr:hypothetical protein [Cereibacter sphaeroides]MCE6959612.1 hypothetical protein [Cereibacter sphaeroides]MCE6974528.1 hypothetical protein [Cereibacter sphaeroides]